MPQAVSREGLQFNAAEIFPHVQNDGGGKPKKQRAHDVVHECLLLGWPKSADQVSGLGNCCDLATSYIRNKSRPHPWAARTNF
jgi:hypothetical protein